MGNCPVSPAPWLHASIHMQKISITIQGFIVFVKKLKQRNVVDEATRSERGGVNRAQRDARTQAARAFARDRFTNAAFGFRLSILTLGLAALFACGARDAFAGPVRDETLAVGSISAVRDLAQPRHEVVVTATVETAVRLREPDANFDLSFAGVVTSGDMAGVALGRGVRTRHPQPNIVNVSGVAGDTPGPSRQL